MAYCELEDILQMVPPEDLADLTTEAGEAPDLEVVAQAIGRADAEIDSYLAVRYALPLSPAPARVQGLSQDLALYHLYSRRSVMPEVHRERYREALAFLKDVAGGRARLEGGAAEPAPALGEAAQIRSDPRTFTRSRQEDW